MNKIELKKLMDDINGATTKLGYSPLSARKGEGSEIYHLYSDNGAYMIKISIFEDYHIFGYFVSPTVSSMNKASLEAYEVAFRAYQDTVLHLLP